MRIALAALLPALMFYLAVFLTVHFVAIRNKLELVPEEELPAWTAVLRPSRILPVVGALVGLFYGVLNGYSVQKSAFFGIALLALLFVGFDWFGRGNSPRTIAGKLISGLEDAGRGMVIIGVLLAGAQILVSMLNMTGIGVTLSTLIVDAAGHSAFLVALIVAVVCMIMGMGIPTTAAYVLVAAVVAPALTAIGVEPLVAHLFVFYYATISVITPPVCVAVFVAAGIAQTGWLPVAGYAVRLAATTYVVPFLLLAYPALAGIGGAGAITLAALKALLFVLAFAGLFGGLRLVSNTYANKLLLIACTVLAVLPGWLPLALAALLYAAPLVLRRLTRGSVGLVADREGVS
jgi:TRAP-type uncharacterized transport system fused permease subunit